MGWGDVLAGCVRAACGCRGQARVTPRHCPWRCSDRAPSHCVGSWPTPDFCSPLHRRPGPRAGPTPTTSPSGRAAWTLSPAGLAICRWSILRWGSTLSSLKTRSPSWGRSTGTLNDSEERCRGGWAAPAPRGRRAGSQTVPPAASARHGAGLRRAPAGCCRPRIGRVQFHYGTLNNYFWNDCYAGLNFFNDQKKNLLKTEFFL